MEIGIAMYPIIGVLVFSFILFYYLYKGIMKDTTKHDEEHVWVDYDTSFMRETPHSQQKKAKSKQNM
ncbi:hypothetical protein GOP56_09895 [Brevibacillus sp. 7WMA2]|uniref:Uncharacterized protein n=1 Tax=Brevibacillus laterosporus LMG 15441 TaxID=1042163 RepID=A0A075R5K3_BRELA|nr:MULTISPECIES: hypothetical protein [Brevibacillus]HAS00969.1 hypothetical protein [Brevibacillus sp.]AIG27872.1 hypothetical protein BRLA_c035600 [Brevibacillus laterosporus LMG 15441]AYK05083.1 hypothetical protein D8Z77_00825 [Brevibacillus laterosporus]ERM19234.1 hypothetical protein P615_10630 [Brevibacillus laterosporus PE36]QIC05896.1 hypothetical protein GOP56_09895 [Brevibacillus sp. 7WMA2]